MIGFKWSTARPQTLNLTILNNTYTTRLFFPNAGMNPFWHFFIDPSGSQIQYGRR